MLPSESAGKVLPVGVQRDAGLFSSVLQPTDRRHKVVIKRISAAVQCCGSAHLAFVILDRQAASFPK